VVVGDSPTPERRRSREETRREEGKGREAKRRRKKRRQDGREERRGEEKRERANDGDSVSPSANHNRGENQWAHRLLARTRGHTATIHAVGAAVDCDLRCERQ
jgi:hypothetical protein